MELLAPAGEFDSLVMAVQNGADAVYVGGTMFSARKNAVNFDFPELTRAVDYCHLRGVKLYLAVNTLVKEFELSDLCNYLEEIYRIGVDAVIVQDFGVLSLVRRCLPELSVNASTQMTVNTAEGVRELETLGVSRVVLARELSKEDISSIRSKTTAELEVFVHGALCMSYSGQCLMSSMLGGRSGNRGACAQPCRLPYTLLENGKEVTKTLPLLSPKDLCLAGRLSELEEIGVDSLKIEGRMKSPEYVGMVTRVYRAALSGEASEAEIKDMLRFFSRGGSSYGYFDGKKYRSMMDYGPSAKISADKELEKNLRERLRSENKVNPVTMEFSLSVGEPTKLTISSDKHSVTLSGEAGETAIHRPMEEERIKTQLEKLGGTPFALSGANIKVDGKATVSVSEINRLRREGVDLLSEQLCSSYRRRERKVILPERAMPRKEAKTPVLCVSVQTEEQYQAAKKMGVSEIYLPYHLYKKGIDMNAVCVLPELPREGQKLDISGAEKVMVGTIGQFDTARGKTIFGGHRLNVYNSEAAEFLKSLGAKSLTISPELNLSEIKQMAEKTCLPLELIAYGRLPLMLMENCIIKSSYRCACVKEKFSLRDRKGVEFPIITEDCRNLLLNSCPIYMADRMDDIKSLQIDRIRLSFTVEKSDLCCIIIDEYQKALSGIKIDPPKFTYTRGHLGRGVL